MFCLVAAGFVDGRDRYINQGRLDPNITDANITVASSPFVVVTSGAYGGIADGSVLPTLLEADIYAAATLIFSIVDDVDVVFLPQREFADCEEVACAGLSTGEYNIRGEVRYCDNDVAGGGWMRLWRVNDSTCESSGWTSARSPFINGIDPFGCRPSNGCKSTSSQSPFVFSEVRGENWQAWGAGRVAAFHTTSAVDGITVSGNNSHVWAFVASAGGGFAGLCPCYPGFVPSTYTDKNLNVTGANWTCNRLPSISMEWKPLFDVDSTVCVGYVNSSAVNRFQREVPPRSTLSVAICKNGNGTTEDVKLSSGDLFVRPTVGFDKRLCGVSSTRTSISTSIAVDGSSLTTPATSTIFESDPLITSLVASPTTAPLITTTIADVAALDNSSTLIGGIVGGVAGLFILVGLGLAAFVRWQRRPNAVHPVAAQGEYGMLPAARAEQYSDVGDVRQTACEYESTSAPLST